MAADKERLTWLTTPGAMTEEQRWEWLGTAWARVPKAARVGSVADIEQLTRAMYGLSDGGEPPHAKDADRWCRLLRNELGGLVPWPAPKAHMCAVLEFAAWICACAARDVTVRTMLGSRQEASVGEHDMLIETATRRISAVKGEIAALEPLSSVAEVLSAIEVKRKILAKLESDIQWRMEEKRRIGSPDSASAEACRCAYEAMLAARGTTDNPGGEEHAQIRFWMDYDSCDAPDIHPIGHRQRPEGAGRPPVADSEYDARVLNYISGATPGTVFGLQALAGKRLGGSTQIASAWKRLRLAGRIRRGQTGAWEVATTTTSKPVAVVVDEEDEEVG